MMADPATVADEAAVRQDLQFMTARWSELGQPVVFEVRAFKEDCQPQTAKFAPDWMDDAVEWVLSMNKLGYNMYAVRNPIRHDVTGSAKDEDIVAAFYLWADCDDQAAAGNVYRFDGPKWTAAVTTGKTPSVRVHTYWALKEPCRDLAAWRAMQVTISQHFASDSTVINPSRIMRIGGTVSFPFKRKQDRGYVAEVTTIRTEYDDGREPVTLEQMARVFGSKVPAQQPSLSQRAAQSAGFQIDVGGSIPAPLDRDRMAIQALSGSEWHNAVLKLTGSYVARGLSDAEIHALTQPLTLAGYTADQTYREVQSMVDGARAKNFAPQPQEAPPQVQAMQAQAEAAVEAGWPTLYDMFDEAAVPPRRWVYGSHYLRSFVSVLASAGGIGKTSMQIVEALAICTGKPLLGEVVHEPCAVWIINLEDPMEEMQRRILAAMKHYHITPDEVRGKLFVDAGRDFRLTFATQTREGVIPNAALVEHMMIKIPERNIGATFIDPFVGAHDVNENDNGAINTVVGEIRHIADKTCCAFGLVHHIRKGNGEDANIDSVRGAGSLIGAARAARVINRVTEEEAMKLGVDDRDARSIFRVDDGKANLAPPADKTVWRKMHGVQIDNGEWIGVAVEFKMPDAFDGISARQTRLVQQRVGNAAETSPLRANAQAKAWAGHLIGEILEIDTTDKAGKARVGHILKTWIKKDVLRIEQEMDARTGREVPVVVVGEWISHDEV